MWRHATEAGGHVQHGQQREPEAGFLRRGDDALGYLARVRVTFTLGVPMQVVKLTDGGIPAFQELHVELCSNGADRLRRQRRDEAVHQIAPRPEAVGQVVGTAALG